MRWHLLWVELSHSKRDIEFLNTYTCQCNLVLKWGFCKCNQVKMRPYMIKIGSTPISGILINEWNLDTDTQHECQVLMKAKIGVIHLQVKGCKDCLQPPKARKRRKGRILTYRRQRAWLCPYFDFGLSIPQSDETIRQYISGVLSHLVCSSLLWQQ